MGENFRRNLDLVAIVQTLARAKECTPSQLALAGLLAQGPDIVPIPGTKRIKYLEENAASVHVPMSAEEVQALSDAFPRDVASGDRYAPAGMATVAR